VKLIIIAGKLDLSMAMNGALAGLVVVTAPCAFIDPWMAAGFSSGLKLLESFRWLHLSSSP